MKEAAYCRGKKEIGSAFALTNHPTSIRPISRLKAPVLEGVLRTRKTIPRILIIIDDHDVYDDDAAGHTELGRDAILTISFEVLSPC